MASLSRAAAAGPPLPDNLVEALQEIRRLRLQLVEEHDVHAERWLTWQQRARTLEDEVESLKQLLGLKPKPAVKP